MTFLGIEVIFIKQCSLNFMSAKNYDQAEAGAKLLSDLVKFSISF